MWAPGKRESSDNAIEEREKRGCVVTASQSLSEIERRRVREEMVTCDYVISVVLGVIMRKSICRFHEIVRISIEFITSLLTVRISSNALASSRSGPILEFRPYS
jgi:hypothetical protein